MPDPTAPPTCEQEGCPNRATHTVTHRDGKHWMLTCTGHARSNADAEAELVGRANIAITELPTGGPQ